MFWFDWCLCFISVLCVCVCVCVLIDHHQSTYRYALTCSWIFHRCQTQLQQKHNMFAGSSYNMVLIRIVVISFLTHSINKKSIFLHSILSCKRKTQLRTWIGSETSKSDILLGNILTTHFEREKKYKDLLCWFCWTHHVTRTTRRI